MCSKEILTFAAVLILMGCSAHAGEVPRAEKEGLHLSHSNSEAQVQAAPRLEKGIRERINKIRKSRGLGPLQYRKALRQAARNHSCRMASERFFSHRNPSGQSVADRLAQNGLTFSFLGENIGMTEGIADPLDSIVEGWMNSEGHRENILNPHFTQTGVGVCRRGDAYFATQVFRRP